MDNDDALELAEHPHRIVPLSRGDGESARWSAVQRRDVRVAMASMSQRDAPRWLLKASQSRGDGPRRRCRDVEMRRLTHQFK
jgi:hypothetical protein